ncbi:signal transduction histidine kinase [Pelomonas saccharophila]|uniref:histidine kinase n=1 Tax=Roseateles saccharophilus TaxID=304 RepID=A0ABU1YU77_ROSSA|nr:hybrid sensor histidine kinase/response regulator [Roseateles saccharophilus]MDR7272278.1 signal transduction histidine kinase [Roseateles saccharophilus]
MTAGDVQSALARRLFMARTQTLRSQWPIAISHAVVAWVLWRDGLAMAAVAWFLTITAVNLARSLHLLRLNGATEADAQRATRVARNWLVVIGLLRPIPVLLTLLGHSVEGFYLITMIMLGLTVGGVSNLAGLTRLYDVWSAPLFLAFCGVWLARADIEGAAIALLLGMMFFLLRTFVRDYGAVLAREMTWAEQLRVERDRAEEAIVARGRFFAAASHDLRQPIAAMRWYGEAVEEHARLLDHAGLRQIGEGIARAMARADPLLAQYLEISRLEAHETALPLSNVDLGALLRQTAEAWEPQARERGLGLALRLPDGVPLALGDEAALRRILDNLVANAIKFTPAGVVTLAAETAGPGRWRVSVSDTGIGIAAEDQGQVFDDFFQIGNAARVSDKGVGLGLSIARRHAERLGSSLRLTSALGQGSRFEFELAAADGEPPPATAPADEPSLPAGLKVLVVDDDVDVQQALKARLQARGWTVQTASALGEALGLWRDGFLPDIVLADYRLGDEHTGAELIAALRGEGCEAPALIITGDTAPDRLAELARSGVEVLHKPVSDALLVQALGRLLARAPA